MSNMLNTIFTAMTADFGNVWVILGMMALVLLVIFFALTQDFFASLIFTMMPLSIMAIANFEGLANILPYIILVLGFIGSLILYKVFSR